MNATCHDVVIIALADHLGVDPLAIEGRQRLEDDWGLDLLDLALLAFRLEDSLEVDIVGEALEGLRTVADLEALVSRSRLTLADELGLGAPVRPSLREELRRTPQRTRRKLVHRQMRRALRRNAA